MLELQGQLSCCQMEPFWIPCVHRLLRNGGLKPKHPLALTKTKKWTPFSPRRLKGILTNLRDAAQHSSHWNCWILIAFKKKDTHNIVLSSCSPIFLNQYQIGRKLFTSAELRYGFKRLYVYCIAGNIFLSFASSRALLNELCFVGWLLALQMHRAVQYRSEIIVCEKRNCKLVYGLMELTVKTQKVKKNALLAWTVQNKVQILGITTFSVKQQTDKQVQ